MYRNELLTFIQSCLNIEMSSYELLTFILCLYVQMSPNELPTLFQHNMIREESSAEDLTLEGRGKDLRYNSNYLNTFCLKESKLIQIKKTIFYTVLTVIKEQ